MLLSVELGRGEQKQTDIQLLSLISIMDLISRSEEIAKCSMVIKNLIMMNLSISFVLI